MCCDFTKNKVWTCVKENKTFNAKILIKFSEAKTLISAFFPDVKAE